MNEVSLWANNNDMAWIMKIAKRLEEVMNFRRPVSRAPPLGEQFLDEANAAREELLAEIQRSAETDVGAEPVETQQADDVTFGHKMMHPAEPNWNVTSEDFADEHLVSLLRRDGKSKVDLGASMHMLKLQLLTAELGKTAWNVISSMHVPDKKTLGVLHSQIMAQELRTLISSLRNNLVGINHEQVNTEIGCSCCILCCMDRILTHFCRIMKKRLTAMYGLTSRGACPLFKPGLPHACGKTMLHVFL